MKKPVVLAGSQSILLHPDRSFDRETLATLLGDALEQNLPRSARIEVTKEQRVRWFDPGSPEWELIGYTRTLGYLHKLYHDMTGRTYDAAEHQRVEEEHAFKARALKVRGNFALLAQGAYLENLLVNGHRLKNKPKPVYCSPESNLPCPEY